MNATNPKKPTASTQPSAMPLNSVENSSSNEHEGGEKMDALNAIIGGLTTWSDRRREATLKKQERIEQKRAVERKNGQSLGAGASGLLGGAVGKGLAFAKRTAGVWIVACALIGGAGAIVENNAAQMNASYDWMLVNPGRDGASAESLRDIESSPSFAFWSLEGQSNNKKQLLLVTREDFFAEYDDAKAKCLEAGACQFVPLSKTDWGKWQIRGEAPAAIAAAGWSNENPIIFFVKTNTFTSVFFAMGVLGALLGIGAFAISFNAAKKAGGLKPAAKILTAVDIAARGSALIFLFFMLIVPIFEITGPAGHGVRLAHPAWAATQSVLDGTLAPEKTSWSVSASNWTVGMSNSTPEDFARLDECLRAGFCAWEEEGVSLGGDNRDIPPRATDAVAQNPDVVARQQKIARLAWLEQSKTWRLAGLGTATVVVSLFLLVLIAPWFPQLDKGHHAQDVEKWETRLRNWIRRSKKRDTETLARVVEAASPSER